MKRIATLLFLGIATPAAAQDRPWGTSGEWYVQIGTQSCSATASRPGGVKVRLSRSSTSPRTIVDIVPPLVKGRDREDPYKGFNPVVAGEVAWRQVVRNGRGGAGLSMSADSVARMLEAGSIRISGPEGTTDEIPLPPSTSLEQDFGACLADLRIAERGSGEPAVRQPRPSKPLKPLFQYTNSWQERFKGGTTRVRLTIAAQGHPLACAVLESSSDPELDTRTCRLLMEGGHFFPATDAQHRPTLGSYDFAIRWTE